MSRIKPVTEIEWLALATRKDDGTRPVLSAIHVNGTRPALSAIHVNAQAAATDGYRLHITTQSTGLLDGLWNPKTLQSVEGTFPNYDMVVPKARKVYRDISDPLGATAQCKAAMAYSKTIGDGDVPYVSLTADDGTVAVFNAAYLADVLRGWLGYPTPAVAVSAPTALEPAHFKGSLGREAVLMPIRSKENGGSVTARLSLDEYIGKAV